jgi:hypothetical protein
LKGEAVSNQPADFFCGDTVTIQASNKPLVDMTIPASLNDYKWADESILRIYNPRNEMVVDTSMCQVVGKPGWYYYRYKPVCSNDCGIGIYRVEVIMRTTVSTCVVTPDTSGVDTTGTSGDAGTEICEDIQVSYFRIMSKERF